MRNRLCRGALALALATAALAGCEKRERTKNSSGSSGLFEEGTQATTNVYRFVGVEQSLTDARKAVTEERWDQALAATDALLKLQPNNVEAKAVNTQARLEMPNLTRWNELQKAASQNEVAAVIRQYRAIADTSMYKARATPLFEKLKSPFVDNQVADARALVRVGRCDDARRVARVTGDWFPDMRARLDDAAANCRPAKPDKEATATEIAKTDDKKDVTPPSLPAPAPASGAVAMAAEAPKATLPAPPPAPRPAAAPIPAPAADKGTLAAALPVNTQLTREPAALPAPAPAAPPVAVVVASRNVPISELEGLRIAGERSPSLPAGAKMIARRDNVKKIVMALKICVSDKGVPTTVAFVKSSDYSDANEKVMAEVRKWRFRPYLSAGEPIPVCTATLLNYQIE